MAMIRPSKIARGILAFVWLQQGMWAKVLGHDSSHEQIVGQMPGMKPASARAVTVAIGVVETAMAIWVVSGRRPRTCAAVQTAVIAGFNAGALIFARESVHAPRALLARNIGIVALVWLAAW